MHEFDKAALLLDAMAENIEQGLIAGPGPPVSEERVAAMVAHLKRFVDQAALYRVWSAKEAKVCRYLAGYLREQAQIDSRSEDPTAPDARITIL
jgi:hypothetical protein